MEADRQFHYQRATNLIKLKSNIAVVQASLKEDNEKREKAKLAKAASRLKERKELLGEGRNPDGVFLARDERAKMRRRKKRLKENIEKHEMNILDRIIVEDDRRRKKNEEEFKQKAMLRKYRAKMSRSVTASAKEAYSNQQKAQAQAAAGSFSLTHAQTLLSQSHSQSHIPAQPPPESPSKLGSRDSRLSMAHSIIKNHSKTPSLPLINKTTSTSTTVDTITSTSTNINTNTDTDTSNSNSTLAHDSMRVIEGEMVGDSSDFNSGSDSDSDFVEEKPPLTIAFNDTRLKALLAKNAQALSKANKRRTEGVKKLVCGKEYKCSKFLSEPSQIEFKDFTVGKTFHKKIVLTNVSFSFNTFKVLDLADEYVDFFSVTYKKVGRMSAGQTATIHITFRPKLNRDIATELPCMAETGPFSIPLLCYTKKAVIAVKPETVDIGAVVMGEEGQKFITIENKGARSVPFKVRITKSGSQSSRRHSSNSKASSGHDNTANENAHLGTATDLRFEETTELGGIEGYSKIRFPVTFVPSHPGPFQTRLKFSFGKNKKYGPGDEEAEWGSARSFYVTVKAVANKVPVSVAEPLIDFQCCVYNKLYRRVCRLQNCAPNALKAQLHVPPALRGFVSFTPSVGYIQSMSHLDIQIKFTATDRLFDQIAKFDGAEGVELDMLSQSFTIPVVITVPDQVLPVIFKITATCVSSILDFSHQKLSFGQCFTNQKASIPVTITNNSPLMQKLAFVELPKELTIQPNDGFTNILPYRSKMVNVLFSPDSATRHSLKITVRTKLGDTYIIPVHGVGLVPPLSFSHPIIKFGAVANRDYGFAYTFVTNTSSTSKTMQFALPSTLANSVSATELMPLWEDFPNRSREQFLEISPQVKDVLPGETVQVSIKFSPDIDIERVLADMGGNTVSFAKNADANGSLSVSVTEPDGDDHDVDTDDGKGRDRSSRKGSTSSRRRGKDKTSRSRKPKKHSADEQKEIEEKERQEKEIEQMMQEQQQKEVFEQATKRLAELEDNFRAKAGEIERTKPSNALLDPSHVEYSDLVRTGNRLSEGIDATAATANGGDVRYFNDEAEEPAEPWSRHARTRVMCFFTDTALLRQAQKTSILSMTHREEEDETGGIKKESNPILRATNRLASTSTSTSRSLASRGSDINDPLMTARSSLTNSSVSDGSSSSSTPDPEVPYSVMYMEVHTTVIKPNLSFKPEVLDFGQLAQGISVSKTIEIHNTSDQPMDITMEPLGLHSPFDVVNALRPIKPGGLHLVVVEFRPKKEKVYEQNLVLRTHNTHHITVPLKGQCVSPKIILAPTGEVDMGDVLAGDTVETTINITNTSIFPFPYSITDVDEEKEKRAERAERAAAGDTSAYDDETLAADTSSLFPSAASQALAENEAIPSLAASEGNLTGSKVFYFVPGEGVVAPGCTQQVKCYFAPDHGSLFLEYMRKVKIGRHTLSLRGRAHDRQVFLLGGVPSKNVSVDASVGSNTSFGLGQYQNPLAFLELELPALYPGLESEGVGELNREFHDLLSGGSVGRASSLSSTSSKEKRRKGGKEGKKKDGGSSDNKKSGNKDSGRNGNSNGQSVLSRESMILSLLDGGHDLDYRPPASSAAAPSTLHRQTTRRQIELTFRLDQATMLQMKQQQLKALTDDQAAQEEKLQEEKTKEKEKEKRPKSSQKSSRRSKSRGGEGDPPSGKDSGKSQANADDDAASGKVSQSISVGCCKLNQSDRSTDGTFEIVFGKGRGGAEVDAHGHAEGKAHSHGKSSKDGTSSHHKPSYFSVEPASGKCSPGSHLPIRFQFDYAAYQKQHQGMCSSVLTVGHWVEARATCVLKAGHSFTGAAQETVEILLRAYVE